MTTVGCRRCGGGLAGSVSVSNVHEGARLAVELAPDLVLFDGSGAAIPPIETTAAILVVNSATRPDVATGYLNEYRHLVSDLVVLTMAEEGSGWEELHDARPSSRRRGRDDAAPAPGRAGRGANGRVLLDRARVGARHVRRSSAEEHGADVVHVSGTLADRRGAARRARRTSRRRSSSSS